MDINFLKIFDLLLPRSSTFSLIIDRTFRKFFSGLAEMPTTIRIHLASIINDIFPRLTEKSKDQSNQLGAPVELSRAALETEYGAIGGQAPGYIQQVLQDAGFDVYLHEWWVPGSRPPVARNPFDYIGEYQLLVNDISIIERNYLYQFIEDETICFVEDNSVRFDDYDGYIFISKRYAMANIEDEYPKYFYIGGETFPNPAYVPIFHYSELVRLIYKLKPLRLRCVLMIVKDIDTIQDSWTETNIIQDSCSELDEIQDTGVA